MHAQEVNAVTVGQQTSELLPADLGALVNCAAIKVSYLFFPFLKCFVQKLFLSLSQLPFLHESPVLPASVFCAEVQVGFFSNESKTSPLKTWDGIAKQRVLFVGFLLPCLLQFVTTPEILHLFSACKLCFFSFSLLMLQLYEMLILLNS